jgi:hypothetical protein
MVDLVTFIVTDLLPLDFSKPNTDNAWIVHISGRAFNRPDWVLVSTTDSYTQSYTWMDKQVLAVELTTNGRVVPAHDHSLRCLTSENDVCYFGEAHGSVNRDFT